jgi:hypothetical protein
MALLTLPDTIDYAFSPDNPISIYCKRIFTHGPNTLSDEELSNVIKYQIHWLIVHTRTIDRTGTYLKDIHIAELHAMQSIIGLSSTSTQKLLISMHKRIIEISTEYLVDAF